MKTKILLIGLLVLAIALSGCIQPPTGQDSLQELNEQMNEDARFRLQAPEDILLNKYEARFAQEHARYAAAVARCNYVYLAMVPIKENLNECWEREYDFLISRLDDHAKQCVRELEEIESHNAHLCSIYADNMVQNVK